MKLNLIASALALSLTPAAHAAIAPGTSGNGELFLIVQNAANQVSFAYDLGIRMDDFIGVPGVSVGIGETPGQLSFNVGANPFWTQFVSEVNAGSSLGASSWAVLAIDSTGNNNPGNQRLLTTARQQATVAATTSFVRTIQNSQFSAGIGATQAGQFFDTANNTGSHGTVGIPLDFSINGASVNRASDPGLAYFGDSGGLTPTLNGNSPWQNTNFISPTSVSTFYYMTRSGTNTAGNPLVDIFETPGGVALWAFDGSTLTYTAPVPEPTTYALFAAGLLAVGAFVRRRKAD